MVSASEVFCCFGELESGVSYVVTQGHDLFPFFLLPFPLFSLFPVTTSLFYQKIHAMAITRTASTPSTLRLLLSVKPNARDSSIVEVGVDNIGVRIAAAPRDGEANGEVVKYLAKVLGVRKSDVRVVRGDKGREKVIEVNDGKMEVEECRRKLEEAVEK